MDPKPFLRTALLEMQGKLSTQTLALVICSILILGGCSAAPAPAHQAAETSKASQEQATAFDSTFSAVVGVFANVPEDARTAQILGTRRQGSGVLIDDDGLVLTIGYLIMEAEEIVISGPDGDQIQASFVAYDHATGFGLVRAMKPIRAAALELGDSKSLSEGEPVLAVSYQGRIPVIAASVVSRRPFAGYWEYLLDNAIFTLPPHHEYGGAALIDGSGKLVGIGSLIVNDAIIQERPVIGNMFVPVESLKPILADLISHGRRKPPVPPWLGVYTEEAEGRVFISRVTEGGPAQQAGLNAGDIIIGVGGKRIGTMIEFFQKVRNQGGAGTNIRLDIIPFDTRDLTINKVDIKSLDRFDWLHMK
ncbi:MAG: serine protease [Rhodospirillales bacterium]|nr:serine protease [Rhodospirillales bacterium]